LSEIKEDLNPLLECTLEVRKKRSSTGVRSSLVDINNPAAPNGSRSPPYQLLKE
jgi:hypothetical protein